MALQTASAAIARPPPKPPTFLRSKRSRAVWRYLIGALEAAKLDYGSALAGLAILADKIDTWREYADLVRKAGERYEEDSNKGSLETDESRAERRARAEVFKDLDEAGMTVVAFSRIRAIDRLATNQGELFGNPLVSLDSRVDMARLPELPPWTMRPAEKRAWADLMPMLTAAGFDFSTAGLSMALLSSAIADWFDCKQWIADHKGRTFAVSGETGRSYEVSASYNRVKIARQIRELLKKNGMTVYSCAKNKAMARGELVDEVLREILAFAGDRPAD
ncbi:hypothetical protein [Chitinimonas koreensis]|uniref:hypothetical protein n=1 Tax=Chitinimonas koreensis TaxID=356302 RepID=UPI0004181F21|nr:hypothetical protein [Chitinimonas koreensis]QNM94910.1 hypothetical protein H9L41_13370 [Chitinimonas koreensis]